MSEEAKGPEAAPEGGAPAAKPKAAEPAPVKIEVEVPRGIKFRTFGLTQSTVVDRVRKLLYPGMPRPGTRWNHGIVGVSVGQPAWEFGDDKLLVNDTDAELIGDTYRHAGERVVHLIEKHLEYAAGDGLLADDAKVTYIRSEHRIAYRLSRGPVGSSDREFATQVLVRAATSYVTDGESCDQPSKEAKLAELKTWLETRRLN